MAKDTNKGFLVVFDLDETLVQLYEKNHHGFRATKVSLGDGLIVGSVRPGVHNFLCTLKEEGFKIAVWTARADKNIVNLILKHLIPENSTIDEFFLFVWTREFCPIGSRKPLSKIWDNFTDFDESNTIMIDDRIDNFSSNEENVINIQRFVALEKDEIESDNEIEKIMTTLLLVKKLDNVNVNKDLPDLLKQVNFVSEEDNKLMVSKKLVATLFQ